MSQFSLSQATFRLPKAMHRWSINRIMVSLVDTAVVSLSFAVRPSRTGHVLRQTRS